MSTKQNPRSHYGSWPSPLTADRVTAGALRFDHIQLDGDDVYWLEGRASEGGRNVIVKMAGAAGATGAIVDVTPPGFNVRTRVHEYGGAAYTVHEGTIYFANFADQRVYRHGAGETPTPITNDGAFYADMCVDATRNRLIAVREKENVNSIVTMEGAQGAQGAQGSPSRPQAASAESRRSSPASSRAEADAQGARLDVLVEGADFYSDPIISPDGTRLAWLQWNHPNMPWDGTELWVGLFTNGGTIGAKERVAGGPEESIFQPEWSPDGALYFVSDRTGWWNLWRGDEPIHPMAADFGKPQWTFSMVTYAFVSPRTIAATYVQQGRWQLAMIDVEAKRFEPVDLPLQPLEAIRANAKAIYFIGGSGRHAPAIVRVAVPPEGGPRTMDVEILRESAAEAIAHGWISVAEPVTFTVKDRDVHAFYYPPTNPEVDPPPGETPPLLVVTHGGPTGATSDVLDPKIQFWTSRGFAVLDVDYSGSTGYGRTYRDRLKGQWGIIDVEDAVGGAEAMVAQGKADPARLIIRGGSAGGYTTLAALTFHRTFKAGASYYGISDLEVLQEDTHKFEARYNDSLLGPWPEAREIYRARSPIHFSDRLSCPIILFQGLDDKVVPPNQSEMMAEAARQKGLKVKYVTFEGEQHGFRKAENIIRALEEELAFYRDVFGIPA